MRDAFGGAFSIKLMLIFLILYVSFICVAINYARAFRVKNRIINIIEQNEGYNANVSSTLDKEIDAYLEDSGYYIEYSELGGKSSCDSSFIGFSSGHGYCIVPITSEEEYYMVETYMVFKLPIVGVNLPIVVKGETRRTK